MKKKMQVFAERLVADEAFRAKAEKIKTKEDLVAFAKSFNIDIKEEDADKFFQRAMKIMRPDGKLSEEELLQVSGGNCGDFYCNCHGGGHADDCF